MENLANLISTGKKIKPITMILHGVHGIGKTTFGTNAPKPIYITGEEIEEIDSAKFPKCTSWEDFTKYLTYIRDFNHDYKTLVIDTLDSIESLLWKHILKDDKSDDMARAMGGYGKAYTLATQMFTEIRDGHLSAIKEKGINIILLCHSTKNKFEDPLTQTSYDIYEMKLHKNNKGSGAYPVFAEWVSIIAFANFEVFTVKDKKSDKNFAIGDGERRMFCTPRPAYDAKNRYNLDDELPLEWSAIQDGVKKFFANTQNPETEILKKEVFELAEKIKDDNLKETTIKNLKSIGNDTVRLQKAKSYILNAIQQ